MQKTNLPPSYHPSESNKPKLSRLSGSTKSKLKTSLFPKPTIHPLFTAVSKPPTSPSPRSPYQNPNPSSRPLKNCSVKESADIRVTEGVMRRLFTKAFPAIKSKRDLVSLICYGCLIMAKHRRARMLGVLLCLMM